MKQVVDDFYSSLVSPAGLFQCNIECDGQTIWMYLHDLKERAVIGDCPIGSLVAPISLSKFKKTYRGKGAPPLTKEYSTIHAELADLKADAITIRWTRTAVVMLIEKVPTALIVFGENRGYSRALGRDGPWGHPWNQRKFRKHFPVLKRTQRKPK